MRDIVNDLGYSRLTVSSVLNGKAGERRISKETARKVLDYVEKKGYVQSRAAISLRASGGGAGVLYTGALYSSKVADYNKFIHRLRKSDGKCGLEIFVDPSPDEDISNGVRELVARGVEKLVCFSHFANRDGNHKRLIMRAAQNMSAVIVYNFSFFKGDDQYEKELLDGGVHLVGVSRDTAAEMIAERLIEFNHRQLIMPASYKSSRQRIFFEKAGVKCHYCAAGEDLAECGAGGFHNFALSVASAIEKEGARALYLHDDIIAAETIMALRGLGLRVPEDISVIGFGNHPISRCCVTPVTTVDIQHDAMLERTFDIINGNVTGRRHEFTPELICRASLGKHPAEGAA
jgi:DNA-binding LacI/PurR family transcriptional regulator